MKKSIWTRENILFTLGLLIIVFEVVNAEALGHPYHYEFLILAAALCGVSITQSFGDRSK